MTTTYYSADSMNSQYTIGTLFSKSSLFKGCSVVVMEVPDGAKAFTTKIEMEKNAEGKEVPVVYIMTDDVDKDIDVFDTSFVTVSKRIFAYFGRVKYNFVGYYIRGEAAKRYGVKDGTIWLHDIYINSNFVDFPLFSKIIKNAGLNILPVIDMKPYVENDIKNIVGKPSLINASEEIREVFVRRRIEDPEGLSSTYNRVACLYRKPVVNAFHPPVTINNKGEEVLPLLPPAEAEVEVEVVEEIAEVVVTSQEEIDKILEEINGEQEKKEENKENVGEKVGMLREFIKDIFDFYIDETTVAEELTTRRIELSKDNYYLILSYVKAKLLQKVLIDKDYQNGIVKDFKFYFVDKITTDVVKDFIREQLKL